MIAGWMWGRSAESERGRLRINLNGRRRGEVVIVVGGHCLRSALYGEILIVEADYGGQLGGSKPGVAGLMRGAVGIIGAGLNLLAAVI